MIGSGSKFFDIKEYNLNDQVLGLFSRDYQFEFYKF
jgi:hypothetical protein